MAQEHTIANFLTANLNCAFPLDTEGLAALQSNLALLHALGRVSGGACVLSGCANAGDAGLVFCHTAAFPDGEVLPVVATGNPAATTLHLVERPVSVTVAGQTINNAYTERHLEWGLGTVNINYADLLKLDTDGMTLLGLHGRVSRVETTLPTLQPLPVGTIIMHAGTTAPENFLLCNGGHHFVADYPELAAALGGNFQTDPREGEFQVPDLRARMPVGLDTAITQGTDRFNALGKAGGEVTHTLTEPEMPKHTHTVWTRAGDAQVRAAAGSAHHMNYQENVTSDAGGDLPHENMPPYLTVNYIIRAK